MGLIATLARIEAMEQGRAVPLATVRHRRISERPLVLVPLSMAGEAAAPLAAMVGTDRDAPRLLHVPQPLDRNQRFAFLAELAELVIDHIGEYTEEVVFEDPPKNKKDAEPVEVCVDAAQILVPNRTGIAHLGLLGRSTRFRRTVEEHGEGEYRVPARVPLLGRWLTHYADRAQSPGACLSLAMTELLSRHWATGQSGFEDLQLATQLAWIDPPEGLSSPRAAELAESARDEHGLLLHPPAGPSTDPEFDNRALAPALARYDLLRNRLRRAEEADGTAGGGDGGGAAAADARRTAADRDGLREAEAELRALAERQLRPTWDDMWRGVDLLRSLPPAAHLEQRWRGDRFSFTSHRDRVASGEAPQPRWDDAVGAARRLAGRERAQAELEVHEALDDPLAMAEHWLVGEAFRAHVAEVEVVLTEKKPQKPRPLVTVRTPDAPQLEPGRKVYRELDGAQQTAEVVSWQPDDAANGPADGPLGTVVLRLLDRMGRRKEPEPGSVPEPGDALCFTLFSLSVRGGPGLPEPEETPWTHGGPPAPGGDAEEVWS